MTPIPTPPAARICRELCCAPTSTTPSGGPLRGAPPPACARLLPLSTPHCRSSFVGSPADPAGKQGSTVLAAAGRPASACAIFRAAPHHFGKSLARRDLRGRGVTFSTHVLSPGIAETGRKRAALPARQRPCAVFALPRSEAPHLLASRARAAKRTPAIDRGNRRYAGIFPAAAVRGACRTGVAIPLDITSSDRECSSNFSPVGHVLRISPRHRGERSRPKQRRASSASPVTVAAYFSAVNFSRVTFLGKAPCPRALPGRARPKSPSRA